MTRKCSWKSLIHLQHKYFYEGNITYKYTGTFARTVCVRNITKTRTRLESPYSTVYHLYSNLRLYETYLRPTFFFNCKCPRSSSRVRNAHL